MELKTGQDKVRGAAALGMTTGVSCLISVGFLLYAAAGSDGQRVWSILPEFACQQVAWIVSIAIVTASKRVRLSNPAVLVLAFAVPYFMYPMAVWCRTGQVLFLGSVEPATIAELALAHGTFMLCFSAAYRLFVVGGSIQRTTCRKLPNAGPVVGLSLGALAITVVWRVALGQGLFPSKSYGEEWYALQSTVMTARQAGGFSYVVAQVLSKVYVYPIILNGIAVALLISRLGTTVARKLAVCLAGAAMVLTVSWLSSGGRSPALITLIVAAVFADMLGRPVPWKLLIPSGVGITLCFLFLGYMRVYRDADLVVAASNAYTEITSDAELQAASEFTGMLSKEVAAHAMFADQPPEGAAYVIRSILTVVPSQVLPAKVEWTGTNELLSRQFMGDAAFAGAGVAGSMIGDCYRMAGWYGTMILPTILGWILATVQRWVERSATNWNLAIAAGFYGMSYAFFRCSLGEVITFLCYTLLLPKMAGAIIFGRHNEWLRTGEETLGMSLRFARAVRCCGRTSLS